MAKYNKLIFTGPVGAGKTTAIASLSDDPPVRTDAYASDMAQNLKPETTVAMDYGVMSLEGGEKLHLYGTPGQERFDFMWDILSNGGIGLILLIDNSRSEPFQDLRFFLNRFRSFIDESGLVIGITRMDLKPEPTLDAYHKEILGHGVKAPLLEVDARSQHDVSLLVQALLYHLDPGLEVEENDVRLATT